MGKMMPRVPWLVVLFFLGVGTWLILKTWWGTIPLLMGIFLFAFGFRKVPSYPPHVGLVTIWGKRYPIVMKEGWRLLAPYFPFLYDLLLINVEKVNKDFEFPDIRTKLETEEREPRAGGEISVTVGLTYFPDYKSPEAGERLISYINSGGRPGVENIIRDLIEEELRQMAAELTWEQYTFARDETRNKLVKKLTGKELTGKAEEELRTNGLPDVRDLGIRISRFTLGRIKAQGELARAAETAAKEIQEKRGEAIELEFVREKVKRFIDLGLSAGEALDGIQTERGKARKEVKTFRGLTEIAEALGRILLKKE